MSRIHAITPCLWFDDRAEEAASVYVSLFPDSRIVHVARYTETGRDLHGRQPGSAMTVAFELDGQRFTALNGGPRFSFTPAVSFQIACATQDEVDHYWAGLGRDGDPKAQQCGWLKDRFGVSWQVVPAALVEMLNDPDRARAERAAVAMLAMKKIDIAALRRAFGGR